MMMSMPNRKNTRTHAAPRDRTAALVGLLLAGLLTASACAPKRAGVTYHDPNMDFSLLQTVAVMPLGNLTSTSQAADRTRDVLMTMLQATGATYVLPPGEVARGLTRASVERPAAPTPDEVVEFARIVNADAVITGTIREYGEVRSGTSSAPVISISLQMMEAQTGRIVWSASSTRGGITASDRLFGGGGKPMDVVTRQAVRDLIDKLFGS